MNNHATSGRFRLGIDLGGTKTEVVVIDADHSVRHRKRVKTPSDDYRSILSTMAELVFEADRRFDCRLPVGIGTPGAISPATGLLRNSNTVCMNAMPLKQDIEALLQRPVKIQNDANCLALSEARIGAAKNAAVVFAVIVGTGTGGGVVVNGQLIEGRHRIAGEWGHNAMPWPVESEVTIPCYCGKLNCIETFLSGTGLSARYRRRYGVDRHSEEVVAAMRRGDQAAIEAMQCYYDQFARALANIINIIDPDIVVVGGGMSKIEEIYHEVPARLPTYVFSDYVGTDLKPAQLGDASGVFGAAML